MAIQSLGSLRSTRPTGMGCYGSSCLGGVNTAEGAQGLGGLDGFWGDMWGNVQDRGKEWWEEQKEKLSDVLNPENYGPAQAPPDARRPAPVYVPPTAGAAGGIDSKTLLMIGGIGLAAWFLLK